MGAGAKPRARRKIRARPAITRTTEFIGSIGNLAVMDQRVRCDSGQAVARRRVIDHLRLIREVAASHHNGAIKMLQDEKMQRRGWQHESEG